MLLPMPHNTADYQTASSTVALLSVQGSGAPWTHPTRSEEIRAGALMLSRLDSTPKRSIALVEMLHDEMLLTLRSAAGHTTKYGHIGT
jgi:hypothetical protein